MWFALLNAIVEVALMKIFFDSYSFRLSAFLFKMKMPNIEISSILDLCYTMCLAGVYHTHIIKCELFKIQTIWKHRERERKWECREWCILVTDQYSGWNVCWRGLFKWMRSLFLYRIHRLYGCATYSHEWRGKWNQKFKHKNPSSYTLHWWFRQRTVVCYCA